MTTPGDPYRPHRMEGGEDRPRDPGERRPAAAPDDPTAVMPRVTRDPDPPGTWVAGPGGPPGRTDPTRTNPDAPVTWGEGPAGSRGRTESTRTNWDATTTWGEESAGSRGRMDSSRANQEAPGTPVAGPAETHGRTEPTRAPGRAGGWGSVEADGSDRPAARRSPGGLGDVTRPAGHGGAGAHRRMDGTNGRNGAGTASAPSGPIGATVYSVDSPDLFPPLPEPEPRPARPGATPPGPMPPGAMPPGPMPGGATGARPSGGRRAESRRRRGADARHGAHPAAGNGWGVGRAAVASSAAGAWDGGPPPFAWPDDDPATGMQAGGEPGGRPPEGWEARQWHGAYGPGHPPPGAGPWQPPRRRGTAAGTTALVLGIASLLLLFVCGIGVVTALVGLVVGVVALSRGTARGRAAVGLLLSVLTLLIAASFAAWLASTGVTRCLDETLYPTKGDLEACLEERLGVPVTIS